MATVADMTVRADLSRLGLQLESANESLGQLRDGLAEIQTTERTAQSFLERSKGQRRFSEDRQRAKEVLEHCRERKRELEERIAGTNARVKALRDQIAKLPLERMRNNDELEDMARDLKRPLP